jgi:hypothetical protein
MDDPRAKRPGPGEPFDEAPREIECVEDPERWDELMRMVAKPKPGLGQP